ncbi:MAG: hypothetical protein U9R21_08235 [Candidatus Thermoplasmatota archaeon]|nr:hypothetical protein [Candidatus Thermoplasmatota archaeon]
MLLDKRKTKKKKALYESKVSSEDTVQSFRSWVRKLEQTANSLSSRLSAVEKRLSLKKFNDSSGLISGNIMKSSIEKIFENINEKKEDKALEELSKLLDKEFSIMREELTSQQIEIATLKEKMDGINSSLEIITAAANKEDVYNSKLLDEFQLRLEKIERKNPPVMKLGDMEIPIEITGVMGGIIAFIMAVIVAADQSEIIISPLFLLLIGFILIGSALFKTFNIGSWFVKFFKKPSKIDDRS